jgi:hypothetical protein
LKHSHFIVNGIKLLQAATKTYFLREVDMSAVVYCPNCKNVQEIGKFCSQCGYDLSKVRDKPLIETTNSSQSYGTLRFVSLLMVLLGWLIIIGSLIAAVVNYSQFVTDGNAIISQGQSDVPLYDPNWLISPGLSAVLIATVGMVFGLAEIAAGQIIMVLLDIRDDVRKLSKK